MKQPPPKDVDEYLARVPSNEARAALQKLRDLIRQSAPEAEELIRYGIPTYKFKGFIASFAAFKSHCSFFPGHTVRDFSEQLKVFKIAKGTIQFKPDHPIPDALVRDIVKARIEENRNA